jgi:hypothetical protein
LYMLLLLSDEGAYVCICDCFSLVKAHMFVYAAAYLLWGRICLYADVPPLWKRICLYMLLFVSYEDACVCMCRCFSPVRADTFVHATASLL